MPFSSGTAGLVLTLVAKGWSFIRGVFFKDADLNLLIKRYYKWIIFVGIFVLIFVGFFTVFIELEDTRRQLVESERRYAELERSTRGCSHHYYALKNQYDTLKAECEAKSQQMQDLEVELDALQKWTGHCGITATNIQNLTCPVRTVTTPAPVVRTTPNRRTTARRPLVSEAPQPKPPTTHALPETPVVTNQPAEKKRRRWWFRRGEEETK